MAETKRRTGKSTRIVDRCVQEFFEKGITYVYEERDNQNMTDEVFDLFRQRMENEHFGVKYNSIVGTFDRIYCYKVEKHNL